MKKSKDCHKKSTKIQVNRLVYLGGAMTVYDTYSATSIDEGVDAINQLHKHISYHDKIAGKIPN